MKRVSPINSLSINYEVYKVQYDIISIQKAYALQEKIIDKLPNCNLSIAGIFDTKILTEVAQN